MWSFVGMPTGKVVVLLVAAVAAICISVARGAETADKSDKLKNNLNGTVITASKDWTPEMLTHFKEELAEFDTEFLVSSEPIVTKDKKAVAFCQMELPKRQEDREATDPEKDNVVAQTEFFNGDWTKKAKAVTGGDGNDAWTIKSVEVDQKASKYIATRNINKEMTEKFYESFPQNASGVTGKSINKFMLGLGSMAAVAMMAW
eukprot:GHVS01084883.1.p1 GENE.GHVS01084883.1~~GHVS01084883.1.p1  ORF type:complete len:203 (-),score=36.16 GHVS01084883.1:687-1295(-)